MKATNEKNTLIPLEDVDNYPIDTKGSKRWFEPKTVGEIENREWYDLLVASLTGEFTDDMTEEVSE